MIVIIYSETDLGSLEGRLGTAEYSSWFVLRAFRTLLDRLGLVIFTRDPAREVDALYRQFQARGEPCVFLCFEPPHKVPVDLACPTIQVFAWEFESLPDEDWDGDPRSDWRYALRRLGRAITHSEHWPDPEPDAGSSPDAALAALPPGAGIGLRDAQLRGWFQNATGELFRGFDVRADDVVLDAGCGDGGNPAFCARLGAHVILADIDPGCVAAASTRLHGTGARGIEALVSDCDPIPLPDATATRIVCTEVLEHVADPARLMAELLRVGRPGALYLLTVPDPAAERLQQRLAPELYWRPPNHLRIFEREDFAALVRSAGLEIEGRGCYGFYQALWWAMFWSCDVPVEAPFHPALEHLERSWDALLETPAGIAVKQAMDDALPKSQLILARKPADRRLA